MKLMIYRIFLPCFLLLGFLPARLQSQSSSADIYKDVVKFGVLANVLYVAAHPDDENTRLISYFSNHVAANTTYLSMTRGDGGQNLIGPEIRDMLGIIRTHELLEARKIDGGMQMFTRANDFGYSKSASETFNIWNREEVLGDVVWAIRKARPDVIINRFSTGSGRPTHGHHTASAILSAEAFDLAARPDAYPEQLQYVKTWQPARIFFNTSWWFYGSREEFEQMDKSHLKIVDIGAYDEITGESNSEIAGRSRSMHKSQGFGSAETRGESLDYLDLIKDAKGMDPKSVFDGIDITWNRVGGGSKIADQAELLKTSFDFKSPVKSIPLLLNIHKAVAALPESYWKEIKLKECEKLIRDCLGLFIELRTTHFQSSPGSPLRVTLESINRSDIDVILESVKFQDDSANHLNTVLHNNQVFLKELSITTPDKLSIPYWLQEPHSEGLYSVPQQTLRGLPADPPSILATVSFSIGGHKVHFEVPVIYRTVDPAEGEIYKPLFITPPVSVGLDAEALVFTKGQERLILLSLTAIKDSISGTLNLNVSDPGWKVTPSEIPWSFDKAGETVEISCTVTPPGESSTAYFRPVIKTNGRQYHHQVTTIDYDHLPYMSVVKDAEIKLQSLDIKILSRPIAYIEGAGDDVDKALAQLGYNVEMLSPQAISPSVLDKYQVIILGIRAFNTVEELSYKNRILFDWVKAGGTMIVQYNTNRDLVTQQIAPYELSISRDRITEESSPVSIIDPDHPALRYPNAIHQSDFTGWVQERGLYFPDQWDENFEPLLEMKDTGDTPTRGAILVAPYGEGFYVYSGLSWFRHLPAGVPGAYRILSNVISLGYKNSKS